MQVSAIGRCAKALKCENWVADVVHEGVRYKVDSRGECWMKVRGGDAFSIVLWSVHLLGHVKRTSLPGVDR